MLLDEPFPEESSERARRAKRRKADQRVVFEYPGTATSGRTSCPATAPEPLAHRLARVQGPGRPEGEARVRRGALLGPRSPRDGQLRPRAQDRGHPPNTVSAINAVTVEREVLGHSDGTPDQRFGFARSPVLPGERIVVRENEVPGKRDARKISEEEGQDAIRMSAMRPGTRARSGSAGTASRASTRPGRPTVTTRSTRSSGR